MINNLAHYKKLDVFVLSLGFCRFAFRGVVGLYVKHPRRDENANLLDRIDFAFAAVSV
jgi:hypothetical protein